jgi:c-di-GMP-related signal transduction protein
MPLSELGIGYRDQIEFSEDLCSVFASLGNVTPGMVHKRAEIPEEFKELITAYPDIFQGFYYIKSETIREKAEYLEEFCEKFRIAV